MKLYQCLPVLSALISSVLSTSIMLPLYIYPDTNAVAWDPVFTAANNIPNMQFFVVVNPGSGPGSTSFPDINYVAGIDMLNRLPNVLVLGYVHTTYGAEPLSAVQANITQYAGWADYPDATKNISVAGIFVDESNTTDADPLFNYMSQISSSAKSTLSSTVTPVVFNAGVKPGADRFYTICDQLVVYECTYEPSTFCANGYQDITTLNQVTSPSFVSKASVLVNQYDGSTSTLQQLDNDAQAKGIGSIYFTSDAFYNTVDILAPQAAALNS